MSNTPSTEPVDPTEVPVVEPQPAAPDVEINVHNAPESDADEE